VAESVEERGSAKGNVKQIRLIRTQCRKCGAFVCQTYG
jgi:hypothetical protein